MKKTFINEGGNIVVRPSGEMGCGIVEMMHLWNKDESGCVIACWRLEKHDSTEEAVFCSIGSRFSTTPCSFDIMEAVRFGQKMADVLCECRLESYDSEESKK